MRTFAMNDSRTALAWRSIQTSCRSSASSRPKTSSAKERRTSRGWVSIQRCSGSRAASDAARATGPGAELDGAVAGAGGDVALGELGEPVLARAEVGAAGGEQRDQDQQRDADPRVTELIGALDREVEPGEQNHAAHRGDDPLSD